MTDKITSDAPRLPDSLVGACPSRAWAAGWEAAMQVHLASPPAGWVDDLASKWERIAEQHGVRTFTGNDHLLFANELRAASPGAADGAMGGGRG